MGVGILEKSKEGLESGQRGDIDMTWGLTALVAIPKDQGSILSTRMATQTCL